MIRIDLARHDPVALRPDRDTGTLTQWLIAHPGVQIMARDRANAYADGARQGAPKATQVADRVHLRQHVAEALEQVCRAHGQGLTAVNAVMPQGPIRPSDGSMAVPIPPPPSAPTAQELATQRRARRLATYAQVWALPRQGWSGEAIARQLGVGRATVFRDLHTPTFPERKGRDDCGKSILNAYKDDLATAGMRAAVTPASGVRSSANVATEAVIQPSPAIPAPAAGPGGGTPTASDWQAPGGGP